MADEIVVNVGESLRRLRGECGYSIKQLSQKSGVSPAGIYKIERNEMVPTITVLMKLAAALNKKVGFFVGEEDDSKDVELVRKGSRRKITSAGSRIHFEPISGRLSNGMLEVGILHIDPGANSGPENMRHPGEELDICLSGRLEFRIKEVKYIVRKDDCIHFKSTVPHSWRNPTDKPVKILYVLSPPPMAYR